MRERRWILGKTPCYDSQSCYRKLIEAVATTCPNAPVVALVMAVQAAIGDLMDDYLTLDVGLVMLTEALQLPRGGAISLFALGRTIGWIGQAIEAYEDDRLIRPRARYTWPPPKN